MQCTIALLMLQLLSGGAFDTKKVSAPPAGCQFLINSGFNACGPRGCNPAPAKSNEPSAALGWIIHSDNQNRPVTNRLLPAAGGCGDGGKMLHIESKGNESGVFQIFDPKGKKRIKVTACVRVEEGSLMVGIADLNGITLESRTRRKEGKVAKWEKVVFAVEGRFNRIFLYNQDLGGGKFDIDKVCIEPF